MSDADVERPASRALAAAVVLCDARFGDTNALVNIRPAVNRRLAGEWGQKVKTRRAQLGLTQAQLAELGGMTQQTVSNLEAGLHIPRDDIKVMVARALGTSPGELFPWPPMAELVA